jgi:nucleoside-diphosphate-sugar epimerase
LYYIVVGKVFSMKYSKILIVGGSGYLGRHLAYYLENNSGAEIFTTSSREPGTKCFHINFDDSGTFAVLDKHRFDLVFILASKLNALGTCDLNHSDLITNTIKYGSFLQYLSDNKITGKIIYTSSMTVYDPENELPVSETGKINPVNTYGLSKYMAETITQFFCSKNKVQGVTMRLPGIYGGDRKAGFVYNTIAKARTGTPLQLNTQGLIYWETIHIEDLCTMIGSFIKAYQWDKTYFVCNFSYGCETDIYATAEFIKTEVNNGHVIETESVKGYVPFYLSNENLKKIISVPTDFYGRLQKYIRESIT